MKQKTRLADAFELLMRHQISAVAYVSKNKFKGEICAHHLKVHFAPSLSPSPWRHCVAASWRHCVVDGDDGDPTSTLTLSLVKVLLWSGVRALELAPPQGVPLIRLVLHCVPVAYLILSRCAIECPYDGGECDDPYQFSLRYHPHPIYGVNRVGYTTQHSTTYL